MDSRTMQELRAVISSAVNENTGTELIGTGGAEDSLYLEVAMNNQLLEINFKHLGKC